MAAMGQFMALASNALCAMTTTCAQDVRLRESMSTTTWSVLPILSTIRGGSRIHGLMALEEGILAMDGGGREDIMDLVTAVDIITDLDITHITMVALGLAQAARLELRGVDSVKGVAAVLEGDSVAVGVVTVLLGGGEVQRRRKPGSSRPVPVVEQLSPWRLALILNSSSNLNSLSHLTRKREGASFRVSDKPCPVSWSHLV